MMRRVRIGDILELQRRPVEIDPLAEYVAIGVRSFGKGIFHYPPTPGSELSKLRFFEISPGELVVSNIKAWEGAISVSTEADRGLIGSNRFLSYRHLDGSVDVSYVRYLLLSDGGLPLIQQASPGSADRNRTLAIDRFERLEIPLPPIDEQRRIVSYVDSLRRQAEKVAFVAKRDERLALVTAPAVVDAVLSRFASERARIGDLAELVSDLVRPGDDPSPASTFVGLQHVESHSGRRIGEAPVGGEKGRKFRFRPGDILYGYLRPYLNKAWVADRDGLCSVDQHVLRPKGAVPAEYIAYALRSRSTLDKAIQLTHSLQLPRLRSGLLLDLEISVPAPAEIDAALGQLDTALARVLQLDAAFRRRRARIDALGVSALNHAFPGLA